MNTIVFIFLAIIALCIISLFWQAHVQHSEEEAKRRETEARKAQKDHERSLRKYQRQVEAERRKRQKEEEKRKNQEKRQLERDRSAAQKELMRLHKTIFGARTVSRLCYVLPDVRNDFQSLNRSLLLDSMYSIYDDLSETLSRPDSQIISDFILEAYNELQRAALAPISLELYARQVKCFYDDMQKSWHCIPNEMQNLLMERMQEMGFDL